MLFSRISAKHHPHPYHPSPPPPPPTTTTTTTTATRLNRILVLPLVNLVPSTNHLKLLTFHQPNIIEIDYDIGGGVDDV